MITTSTSPTWAGSSTNLSARSKARVGTRIQYRPFSANWFLSQVLVAALPAAALLGMGQVHLAGYAFWGMLGLLVIGKLVSGQRDELLALILAVAPFVNLFRQFAFYNVILCLFLIGVSYYWLLCPGAIWLVVRNYTAAMLLLFAAAIYYSLSFYNTRDYAVNLRLFELGLTIVSVLILSRSPAVLGGALVGLTTSACLVGLSMLPYVRSASAARLGMIEVDGLVLGNPTQLGVPLAFGFLALLIDGGRWVCLQNHVVKRYVLLAAVLPLLALTTSRASWLVAASGMLVCALVGSRQRIKLVLAIGAIVAAAQLVMLSPWGGMLERGLNRTFDENRSMRHRTSGRSDQWIVASFAFSRSFESMLRGYGPGNGAAVYAEFSREVEGVKYGVGKKVALHSLFMQIAVESGIIGLTALLVWLTVVLWKVFLWMRRTRVLLPLVCCFSYILIVFTVSGNDVNSGIFLGIALLATGKLTSSENPPEHAI